MGLFDGYFDPRKFREGGGLLGRLLALQQQQGRYQPGAGLDQAPSVPLLPIPQPMRWPTMPGYGQASFGAQTAAPDLASQYQALRPVLGDHDAMLATVNPDIGKTLIAQALAGSTKAGNTGDANSTGNPRAGLGNEANSIAGGQPPGLSKTAYLEIPTNPNQAFGELSDIRERNRRDTVSREDYVSGVRDGNVTRNSDGSLDVTNGTVVTFSYKDGRAKTVTVTNNDIAHIDGNTGEVVIQKSPLGDGI